MGPRNDLYPSLIIIFNDNLHHPLTPCTTRGVNFSFHRNWYVKIPELCPSLGFANAIYEDILKTELKGSYNNKPLLIG